MCWIFESPQRTGDISAKYGLKLHFGKTKLMTWDVLANSRNSVSIGGHDVDVLKESCGERYLGRKLAFQCSQEVELRNRIAAGWAAFNKHKAELCGKFYRLRDRLKLFDATVTPAVLYASSTWALTKTMEKQLTTTRRRMLRYVCRLFCKTAAGEDEEWIHYMKRSAQKIDELSEHHGMHGWINTHRRRKWQLAGRLARASDERWSKLVLEWRPNAGHGRCRGRPATRWTDELERFAGGDWQQVAQNEEEWNLYSCAYCSFCHSE
jgi:hypothetical protein